MTSEMLSLTKDPTIVEYFSEHERYKCGYCGSADTNYSHGMWAHQMTVIDYQDLIDRGWRRSGKYCYKPTMSVTCCPQYPIRCEALNFKLNKSHKKQIKKVNRYLITGIKSAQDGSVSGRKPEDGGGDEQSFGGLKGVESSLAEKANPSNIVMPGCGENKQDTEASRSDTSAASGSSSKTQSLSAKCSKSSMISQTSNTSSEKHIPKSGAGPDPRKPKCRKAKEIRAELKAKKEGQKGDHPLEQKKVKRSQEKSLEDFLSEPDRVENPAHKLELRLLRSNPPSRLFSSTLDSSHTVYYKYQLTVHRDPPSKPVISQFKRFLCDSPLRELHESDGPPEGYGSFHQQYILDGKIIAVGVIDILPSCVSSVYLYYDPEYSFLGLGVYSALRELALVRRLQKSAPDLKYYYMGFYIHSCTKMRYKGQFVPSFLACPETYKWLPIEECRAKLDASKYARLSGDEDEDKESDIDVGQVLVLNNGTILPYCFYQQTNEAGDDEAEVKEYASFVGKACSSRMLLVRQ
ncbi:unnamed protein product [Lymnaea stagnalis]|uniref:Arginyl-tRNA--protein transferase 1 n=1 Tax=Lymnaea stagnalis TaxID=6523 RepID=A0AAV2I8U5_LYMST